MVANTLRALAFASAFTLWHFVLTFGLDWIAISRREASPDLWGPGTFVHHVIYFPLYADGPARSLADFFGNSVALSIVALAVGAAVAGFARWRVAV